jgi:CubicO group peptidase (beta-lactamase class C family)
MRHSVVVSCLICVCLSFACAQSPDAAVDDYIRSEMQMRRIPGLGLLVVRDGQTVKSQGYGYSNVELQVPVKPETIFQSGSMGKQFTATAIMMLVEEGKLSLDDPLTKFFPDAPPAWKNVKIRHLLSHTGGFTDYPKDFDFRRDYTEDQLLKIVEGIRLPIHRDPVGPMPISAT